jgi:hypothetical protein
MAHAGDRDGEERRSGAEPVADITEDLVCNERDAQ